MKKFFYSVALMALTACMTFTSCSSDDNDNNGGGSTTVDSKEVSFVVTSGDPASDLTGGVYMKVYSDLSTAKSGQSVYGASDAVRSYDSFTQVTYNKNSGIFTGSIYARGASEQGLGSKKAGLRSY